MTDEIELVNYQTDEIVKLIQQLRVIRQDALDLEAKGLQDLGALHPTYAQSARNLLHYIALRRHELRPLQKQLSALGLSSLGRAESHVLASLNRVLETLHRLAQLPLPEPIYPAAIEDFDVGIALLEQHTEALLGLPPENRMARIMVTMPTEAADDPSLIGQLLSNGMDCMRINCAHDDAEKWQRMIDHLRHAEQSLGRKCRILMDIVRCLPSSPTCALARAFYSMTARLAAQLSRWSSSKSMSESFKLASAGKNCGRTKGSTCQRVPCGCLP